MAEFRNIEFVQADVLKPEEQEFQDAIGSSDAVIHTVGALLEGDAQFDYRQIIREVEGLNIGRLPKDPLATA